MECGEKMTVDGWVTVPGSDRGNTIQWHRRGDDESMRTVKMNECTLQTRRCEKRETIPLYF